MTRGEFASTEQLLPALDQVRIGRLKGNHFVLIGLEDLSYRIARAAGNFGQGAYQAAAR